MAVRSILTDSGATEVRTAVDEAERQLFWKGRKSAFPAVGRISPDYYCMDGTIPRRQLPHVLRRISEMSMEYGLPVANVFHAGDGNLHPLILFDANKQGELQRTEELGRRILLLCVEVGGTITGEHGVGIEKIDADVRAVQQRGVEPVPRRQGRLRSVRTAQSRQGRPDAASLRRIRRDACASRATATSRTGALLDAHAHD